MKKVKRNDVHQQVTDSIISSIEKGDVLPWQCPWTKTGVSPFPYNWQTKSAYSGINILLLWMRAQECGFTSNAWLTYKQASSMGGNVRKGEKSVRCIFVQPVTVDKDGKRCKDENEKGRQILVCNSFSLFNLQQIDGLDNVDYVDEQPVYSDSDSVDAINAIATQYCENSGLIVKNGGDQAYYSPSLDLIRMPTTFNDGSGYSATFAHELIHSTGHKKRLDRFADKQPDLRHFKEEYAFEELVAEIGASFICAELAIDGQHSQHVSYVSSWLKHLKNDKRFIFRAAALATKAYQHVLSGGIEVKKAA